MYEKIMHDFVLHVLKGSIPPPPLKMCDTGEIEDEIHFVTACNKFRQIRQNIFEKMQNVCPNFGTLSSEDKFSYLMSSGGSVLKLCSSMPHGDAGGLSREYVLRIPSVS